MITYDGQLIGVAIFETISYLTVYKKRIELLGLDRKS